MIDSDKCVHAGTGNDGRAALPGAVPSESILPSSSNSEFCGLFISWMMVPFKDFPLPWTEIFLEYLPLGPYFSLEEDRMVAFHSSFSTIKYNYVSPTPASLLQVKCLLHASQRARESILALPLLLCSEHTHTTLQKKMLFIPVLRQRCNHH